ncbi:hypothetical protein [Paracoccus sp. PAR01]|uniref:hypothetical protein n=1 Tax=Paracoccus sp. PAR01 TaxID=2769282 RepID=UPI001784AE44|nr:hypothetical protein [Paracoccus sp. PAR01]MBD9528983.1 hypothetical protein [Paracoccus sp. PAR01]
MSRAELEYLASHPDLIRIFAAVEKAALDGAITAPINDDETRRNLMAEVRAIRSVRRKLRQAAAGQVTLPDDTEA